MRRMSIPKRGAQYRGVVLVCCVMLDSLSSCAAFMIYVCIFMYLYCMLQVQYPVYSTTVVEYTRNCTTARRQKITVRHTSLMFNVRVCVCVYVCTTPLPFPFTSISAPPAEAEAPAPGPPLLLSHHLYCH